MAKKATKKRQGRPPKPKDERRVESVRIALTAAEKRQIERAAASAGLSISDFGRISLLKDTQ